jgi:hypothetical protein
MADEQPSEEKKNEIMLASQGMQLESIDDMYRASQMFHGSGLCRADLDTPQKICVVLQAGAELGFLPWQSLQSFYVVHGRVGMDGAAMVGLIRKNKTCEYLSMLFEGEPYKDSFSAIVLSKRRDEAVEHTTAFSVGDARLAKLWGAKDNWTKYPKDMLTWRAVSRHARLYYPDVITGFYTKDELEQMEPPTPLRDGGAEPGVDGLMKRIESQTKTPEAEAPASAIPEPERPKKKRGRPKKEKLDAEESKPEPQDPEPTTSAAQEPEISEHEPEGEPTTIGKDKYKCARCDRQFPEMKDGKCPFCFGDCTMLPG